MSGDYNVQTGQCSLKTAQFGLPRTIQLRTEGAYVGHELCRFEYLVADHPSIGV